MTPNSDLKVWVQIPATPLALKNSPPKGKTDSSRLNSASNFNSLNPKNSSVSAPKSASKQEAKMTRLKEVAKHGKYTTYKLGDHETRVLHGSTRERVLKAVAKAPPAFRSPEIAHAANLKVATVSGDLTRLAKDGVISRSPHAVTLPGDIGPLYLYTRTKQTASAIENYIAEAFKAYNLPDIVKAYSLIKSGGVYASVEFHKKYGLIPLHYLKSSYGKAGLLAYEWRKISEFYYNPNRLTREQALKALDAKFKQITAERERFIQRGYDLEKATYDFLEEAKGRLAFVLTDFRPQVVKEIDGRKRIFDAVCYFELRLIETKHKPTKLEDVKYQSGHIICPVECKNRKHPIGASTLDEMILDSRACYGSRTLPILIGEIGNTAWQDMAKYPAIVVPTKQFTHLKSTLDNIENGNADKDKPSRASPARSKSSKQDRRPARRSGKPSIDD